MKSILVHFSILLLLAVIITSLPLKSHGKNLPLIKQTCKQTPYYDLCVISINSDPRSNTANDVKTLAVIMVDVIKSKATQAFNLIKGLKKKHPELGKAFSECSDKYNAVIIGDVPQAMEAVTKGDLKFAVDAATDAAIEADSCEESFSGKSPMTQLNKLNHDVAVITTSIVKIMMMM